jgi:hypothetical protein
MVSGRTMASGPGTTDLERDGIRVVRASLVRRDVWGVVVVGLGVIVGLWLLRTGAPPVSVAAPPRPAAMASAAPAAAPAAPDTAGAEPSGAPPTIPTSRGAKLRALRALGITPHRGPDGKPQIDAAPLIGALNAAGINDGIAAFPPPGTDPPRSGVIVPDDWVLPEGYVRHYQTTDDGEPLPPILMFHPDYTFTDEQGNPIAIPPDRIVPPELVPPGLPVRMLELPAQGRPR